MKADINCDMGEGMDNEEAILPYISSANIACGYHAGDKESIYGLTLLCQKYGVAIGAHPSFQDRINFGRKEIQCTAAEVTELVQAQLIIFRETIQATGAQMQHVKPHGALYNMSARDPVIAKAIAEAVRNFDRTLVLVGLYGSHSISEAAKLELKTAAEVFADRSYQDDGSLTARTDPRALLDIPAAVHQVRQMLTEKIITSLSGKKFSVQPGTICIHSDTPGAEEMAKAIHHAIAAL